MKNEVAINQASRLINSGMLIMVTSGFKDKDTITPCAWHLPISKEPPLVGVALSKKHFSSELIKQGKEFVINVPQWSHLDKLMVCAKASGRQRDKFKESGLTKTAAFQLKETPLITECIGHIECRLEDIKEIGDHYFFIGKVAYASADADFFKDGFWDTNAVELIFHLGGKNFFKSSPYSQV